MISFKGVQYPKDVIPLSHKQVCAAVQRYAVYFYVRYAVSYLDLEEILDKRGVKVDHATLNRLLSGIL